MTRKILYFVFMLSNVLFLKAYQELQKQPFLLLVFFLFLILQRLYFLVHYAIVELTFQHKELKSMSKEQYMMTEKMISRKKEKFTLELF